MRLIDADDFYELIDGGYDLDFDEVPETKRELLRMINDAPTIDAVPVVRCKDCKFGVVDGTKYFCRIDGGIWCDGNWFCANGERREDEQETET